MGESGGASSALVELENSEEDRGWLWGFVVVDEDTVSLFELCCARILVRLRDFDPPKFVEVVVGGNNFMIQLWWEIFPYLETKQSSEKKMGLRHNGKEGEARCGGGGGSGPWEAGDKDVCKLCKPRWGQVSPWVISDSKMVFRPVFG